MTLIEELRRCFLFEALTDEQLDWLVARGEVVSVPGGTSVYAEGDAATYFFVLLDGEIQLTMRSEGADIVITTSSQRGVYAGATRAFVDVAPQVYPNGLRTVRDTRFFRLLAEDFAAFLHRWFPMAVHLLDGLFVGMTNMDQIVGQREKLVALGAIAAGLAHELNNPAAAAGATARMLRRRVVDAQEALVHVLAAAPHAVAELLPRVSALRSRPREAAPAGSLELGDREDELAEWLASHDVGNGWELAASLASVGVDGAWLDEVAAVAGPAADAAVRWIAAELDLDGLVDELEMATGRISTLVGVVKEYSHLDQAPSGDVDVHDGLESTLVLLGHKMGRVEVVRDYDRGLPEIPAFPSELNQVWTNLVDNALTAMEGSGRLTVRTAREGDAVLVEITDTGPGIPPELQRRVFEPFFTTKEVGLGTGLGLDVSHRVVVGRHHGDIRVVSSPGDTRFQVRLPIRAGSPPTPRSR
ncbi:MAG TPA: ATP-binding protein [Acidimicrobiales bacterium]|nr:ATP-binding protein [Acidimicrobiales bacterium]